MKHLSILAIVVFITGIAIAQTKNPSTNKEVQDKINRPATIEWPDAGAKKDAGTDGLVHQSSFNACAHSGNLSTITN